MRLLIVLCLLASALSAPALIVHGDPGGEAHGFLDYVGKVGGASGVFLGEHDGAYWVLTANHVGSSGFTIGGVTYATVSNSVTHFEDIDLCLFQISIGVESPLASLAPLGIAETAFSGGTVYVAGHGGTGQSAGVISWPDGLGGDTSSGLRGYTYTGGVGGVKWGQGAATSGLGTLKVGGETLQIRMVASEFIESEGSFLGVDGDSGGGFFQYVDGSWLLVGITLGSGQLKDGYAVFDHDVTAAIDLGEYADRIYAAIPEPSVAGLFAMSGVAGALFGARRRFRLLGR